MSAGESCLPHSPHVHVPAHVDLPPTCRPQGVMYPGCCLPVDRDSSPSSLGDVLPDGVAECPAHEHYALKVDDWTCEDGWMVMVLGPVPVVGPVACCRRRQNHWVVGRGERGAEAVIMLHYQQFSAVPSQALSCVPLVEEEVHV